MNSQMCICACDAIGGPRNDVRVATEELKKNCLKHTLWLLLSLAYACKAPSAKTSLLCCDKHCQLKLSIDKMTKWDLKHPQKILKMVSAFKQSCSLTLEATDRMKKVCAKPLKITRMTAKNIS